MNLREAQLQATLQLARHGLWAKGWRFRFDGSRKVFGRCWHRTKEISLSSALVELNNEATVMDTILHEIAHALVDPGEGHGIVWQRAAVAIGCAPVRCYSDEVIRPAGRWQATCPACGREFHKHRMPDMNRARWCRTCGQVAGRLSYARV